MNEDFEKENFLNYDRFLDSEKEEEEEEGQENCDLEDGCLYCGS